MPSHRAVLTVVPLEVWVPDKTEGEDTTGVVAPLEVVLVVA